MRDLRKSWKFLAMVAGIVALGLLAKPVHAQETEPQPPESTPIPTEAIPAPESVDPIAAVEQTSPEESPEGEGDTAAAGEAPAAGAESAGAMPEGESISPEVGEEIVTTSNGDPYYSYLGITHYFLPTGGNCSVILPPNTCVESSTNTPIMDAINSAVATVSSGAVVIYVEGNATYVEDVAIASNKVNGLTGKLVSGSYPTIDGNVSVSGLTVPFAISGFSITGELAFTNNTGMLTLTDLDVENPEGDGLAITGQKGAVILNRVESSGNLGNGAEIDTSTGTTSATVSITNSAFDGNNSTDEADCGTFCGGLRIVTNNAAVTVNGVSASGNHGRGVEIVHPGAVTIRNSNISENASVASSYYYDGITLDYQSTSGSLTIENSLANGNSGGGLALGAGTFVPGNVVLKNFEASDNKDGAGIELTTRGMLTLENVIANGNTGHGAWMDNSAAVRTVAIKNGTFNANGDGGLEILSKGSVTLTHVDASGNTAGDGIHISTAGGAGSVTLTAPVGEMNQVSGNEGSGLNIEATGSITLSQVSTIGNQGSNAIVRNNLTSSTGAPIVAAVTISLSEFSESVKGNGLVIQSNGNITLKDSGASGNLGTVGDIDLPGTGVEIFTRGTVVITNLTANDNRGYGLNIDPDHTNLTGNVTLTATTGKRNSISGNGGPGLVTAQFDGMDIQSIGTIVIGQTDAQINGGKGAWLSNVEALSAKPITVTDCTFVGNEGEGLDINSMGALILTGVTSSQNSRRDTFVGSHSWTVSDRIVSDHPQDIWEFSGSTADSVDIDLVSDELLVSLGMEYWNGLTWVPVATGVISGDGATAQIDLANLPSTGTYRLVVKSTDEEQVGQYRLSLNDENDLNVLHDYEYDGIHLENGYATGSVTVKAFSNGKGLLAEENSGTGLDVYTWGAVSLSNTATIFNNISGVVIDACGEADGNQRCQKVSNVTVTGTGNAFDDNRQFGLWVKTAGAISLSNFSASGNGVGDGETHFDGVRLRNTLDGPLSSPMSSVTVTASTGSKDQISGNARNGIEITTWGIVTVTRVNVSANDGQGMTISSLPITGSKSVSVSESSFNENGMYPADNGLSIVCQGAVTLKGVVADGNAGWGLDVDNSAVMADINVQPTGTLGGLEANGNETGGFKFRSHGAINLSKVTASSNGGNGAEIDNSEVPGKAVNISNGIFNGNGAIGIQVRTKGPVTWTVGGASGNGADDEYGAVVLADGGITAYSVILSNLTFNGNHGGGVTVNGLGNASLNNITASDNLVGSGIFVDVCRKADGVCLGSGAVTATGVTAERNAGNGFTSVGKKGFTLTNGRLNHNGVNGLQVEADGNVTLNGVTCWYNGVTGGDGIQLVLVNSRLVSILNSLFMANRDSGINIRGAGTIVPVLTGTNYFGNFRQNGKPNLWLH